MKRAHSHSHSHSHSHRQGHIDNTELTQDTTSGPGGRNYLFIYLFLSVSVVFSFRFVCVSFSFRLLDKRRFAVCSITVCSL